MNIRPINADFEGRMSLVTRNMEQKGFQLLGNESLTKSPFNLRTGRFDPVPVTTPTVIRSEKKLELDNLVKKRFPNKRTLVCLRPMKGNSGVFFLIFAKAIDETGTGH